MDFVLSFVLAADCSQMNVSTSSKVLNSLLVKFLLNFCHIFSAGFNRGL